MPFLNHKAEMVADYIINRWIAHHGILIRIHSDNTPEFRGHVITQLKKMLSMKGTFTTPYRPQSNGLCERMNQTIENIIKCTVREERNKVIETIDNPAEFKMQDASDNVVKLTEENNTRINGVKTKEMITTIQKNPPPIPPLNINSTAIERVKSSKLLGIIISDDLKWLLHVDSICCKASRVLIFCHDYVDLGWSIWNLSSIILVLLGVS